MTTPTIATFMPAPTVEHRLPITPEQVALLNEAEAVTQAAIARTNLILATILAGHGLRGATFRGLQLGDPPEIVVSVPQATPISESPPVS